MNILPKKRWHVRTKENIARVRRDEAKAAEDEKERQRRIELAEKEARTNLLRDRARAVYDGRDHDKTTIEPTSSGHINFFEELEKGEVQVVQANTEYEKEKKEEKEKYEKQIGYLTYLGQDTNEATGNVSWYNKLPSRSEEEKEPEVFPEKKARYDPLNKINFYLGRSGELCTSKKAQNKKEKLESSIEKHKKRKKKKREHSPSSEKDYKKLQKTSVNIEELRAKRLKRETEEKLRAAAILAKLRGDIIPNSQPSEKPKEPIIKQKYNSQFNPHIAKQNQID